MYWLGQFNWTIRNIESTTTTTNQSEKDRIFRKFEKFFKMKRTSENFLIERQLKSGELPIKQKAGPRPNQLKSYFEKEINKLVQSEDLDKMQNIEEDCLVTPVV